MQEVLTVRDVLEVIETVISRITVFVVDLHAVRVWPRKGKHHETMNGSVHSLAKVDVAVPLRGLARAKYLAAVDSFTAVAVRDAPVETANSTDTADLISPLKSGDVAPLFTSEVRRGKLLISHFATPVSVLVKGMANAPTSAVPCFLNGNYTPILGNAHSPEWSAISEMRPDVGRLRRLAIPCL
jgi:hypothetical protein